MRASNLGAPVTLNNPMSSPARAYFDAAKRLRGETVEVVVPLERKGLIGRLFGRRVA
jgi:septum site-determining protein MinD